MQAYGFCSRKTDKHTSEIFTLAVKINFDFLSNRKCALFRYIQYLHYNLEM